MNRQQFIQQLQKGQLNPKNLITQMIGDNNPIASNLITMISNGDVNGITEFNKNYCKEHGINYEEAFNKFKNSPM